MNCLLGNCVAKFKASRTVPCPAPENQRPAPSPPSSARSRSSTRSPTAGELGTNEIARAGINASTVSRLLATLAGAGFVEHVPASGRYRLGLRLLELGNAALDRLDLREVARPTCRRSPRRPARRRRSRRPGDPDAVTVDFVQSASSVQSVARLGRPSVAHATATGKVLLAFGGALPARPLSASRTGRSPTGRARAEVTRVRERGWAEAVGEREDDLNAIAAPVFAAGRARRDHRRPGPASRFDAQAMGRRSRRCSSMHGGLRRFRLAPSNAKEGR